MPRQEKAFALTGACTALEPTQALAWQLTDTRGQAVVRGRK